MQPVRRTSCFCLEDTNPVRALSARVIQHVYFDRFIILVIVLNSVILALADYTQVSSDGELVSDGSWQNTLLLRSEVYFTAIFTAECVIKITALGFYGDKFSYLGDQWNWIDFAVVVSGYESHRIFCYESHRIFCWPCKSHLFMYCRIMSLIPGVPNLSILRTLRVMRPIKVLSTNKG